MITITTNIPEHRIAELLCCAYEGGSNYWARQEDGQRSPYRFIENDPAKDLELVPGFRVRITDIEDEEKSYELTRAALERGLQIMAEKYPRHWAEFLWENEDAETGDVFLQCALFGEIVYG